MGLPDETPKFSKIISTIFPPFCPSPSKNTQAAGSLWYEAAIEGSVLWEHTHKVSFFLQTVRKAMAAGKIQRRLSHGHPYWIKLDSKS